MALATIRALEKGVGKPALLQGCQQEQVSYRYSPCFGYIAVSANPLRGGGLIGYARCLFHEKEKEWTARSPIFQCRADLPARAAGPDRGGGVTCPDKRRGRAGVPDTICVWGGIDTILFPNAHAAKCRCLVRAQLAEAWIQFHSGAIAMWPDHWEVANFFTLVC